MARIYTFLIAVLALNITSAQSVDDFQFMPINEPLSQRTVTDILQDHNGFLWIGTRNGLNKYDGVNMIIYEYDEYDSTSISSGYVRTIFEDSRNNFWIGTNNGLCLYNEDRDCFERLVSKDGDTYLETESIMVIFEDSNRNLWFGTEKQGLFHYNFSTGEFTSFKQVEDDPFSLSGNYITGIVEDDQRNLWVSTWDNGLNLYDQDANKFVHYKKEQLLPSDVIRGLYKGKSGRVWMATHHGLYYLDKDDDGKYIFVYQKLISKGEQDEYDVILSVMEDSKDRLWVGTENRGLNLIDLKTNQSTLYSYDSRKEYTLQHNSVWSLYEDNTGIVWVGTFNKGIFKKDENSRKFQHYKHSSHFQNSLSDNNVSSFAEDQYHNVWVGTDGGGLNYWNVSDNSFTSITTDTNPGALTSNSILTLYFDSQDNLWLGTWGGGINVKWKNSKHFEPFQIKHDLDKHQGQENIFSIVEDARGRIWFAAFRDGLFAYDPSTGGFLGFQNDESNPHSISSNFVRCLLQDSKGQLWIGTEGGGLNKMFESNGQFSFKRFTKEKGNQESLSDNTVVSLLEDVQGRLWVGTSGGLNLMSPSNSTFKRFGKREGLSNEFIYSMQQDSENNLWVSSNRGISKLDMETSDILNFTESDGLQAMEFFKNSSYQLSSGELLFGGIEGFNKFAPDKIRKNSYEPKVYFLDFKISNESVKVGAESPLKKNIGKTERINLEYSQNDFSFEFAVLSFSQSSKNEYAYQLVNYDDDWQYIGNRRNAYYTNVPPGGYTFKVKGTNNDGIWSDKIATIDITISPAWYNTYWAYSLYIILITALLTWGIQTIVNRERLQTQLKVEHLELEKLHELDDMKSRFFANISHEFRSPLTLILGPLKAMYQSSNFQSTKEQVKMMIRNAESLLNLINQLLELSKLESGKMKLEAEEQDINAFLKPIIHSFSSLANRKFISYKVEFPSQEIKIFFDKEKLEKIIVNLLSNAFKYTPEFGKVTVSVEELHDNIAIRVEDNGIGIPEDDKEFVFNRYYRVKDNKTEKNKGTGIGLSLTKELVELHHGQIDLSSEEDKGTVFTVFLQKGKGHLSKEEIVQKTEYAFENKGIYEKDEKVNNNTVSDTLDELEDQISKLPLILVVEDNPEIRTYIKQTLESEYQIIEAENGLEGRELALERIPDLIISDIMMPEMDGYELCRAVKKDLKTSHIPVILLTAKASNESAIEGFEIGADYFITKPFNPRLLSLRIRNVLNIRDQIQDRLLNRQTLNIEPKNVKIASKDEEFIAKAVSIVEENMSNSEFYVDDLGRELGLSRMQLYRKLKGLIGQSANEFVRSIRLKRAAQLIKQNQMTISEITYEVGFNDLQYFRDCFKKQFGMNPSDYAQSFVESDPA